jgi:tetratricopeptide (TPR) repeat protein
MQRAAEPMTDELARQVADQCRRAVQAHPNDAESYRRLGAALRALGDDSGASDAEMAAIYASQHDPLIQRAASAMMRNDLPTAEHTLRQILQSRPNDVAAIRMLGEVALRVARPADAERHFRQALQLAPAFEFARRSLVSALHAQNRAGEALEELDKLGGREDDDLLAMRAAICSRIGRFDEAARLYGGLAERDPDNVELWISLANVRKFAGDQDGAVKAYRRVLEIEPNNGEAWWSLADVKTLRFSPEDITSMETALKSPSLSEHDRLQLHFALGKALEDARQDERAFAHYSKGNAIRARHFRYEPEALTELVAKIEATVTKELLEAREGMGCNSRAPIFILGMPRAGSTLVEQMLASHPEIEGTAELPDIIILARQLEEAVGTFSEQPWVRYPGILADLSGEELQRLGTTYLERTKVQRNTDRPYFTDKMPNNWLHMGLIRLILPKAKVVDIRRNPLACGFSNFKQHYARGQEFSYDLDHFGQYYRDYVRLMRHFDEVSPGYVHRVIYEKLVEDPRGELTKLMDYLEVPFDEAQLRFYETKRDVRTASAEQVRRPINSKGVDQWRRFERWLGPLKRSLGPLLKDWQR